MVVNTFYQKSEDEDLICDQTRELKNVFTNFVDGYSKKQTKKLRKKPVNYKPNLAKILEALTMKILSLKTKVRRFSNKFDTFTTCLKSLKDDKILRKK